MQLSLAQIGECPPGQREGVAGEVRTDPAAAQPELALGNRTNRVRAAWIWLRRARIRAKLLESLLVEVPFC